jgi:hypothetical protein
MNRWLRLPVAGAADRKARIFSLLLVLPVLLSLAGGCVSVPKRNPVPEDLVTSAKIPDFPERARFWGDEVPPWTARWYALTKEEAAERYPAMAGRPHAYLAISGGGANGAFGAGLLSGWTASGTRPEFTMVTGISTGALIAPFAFLGPDYDHVIEEVYTTTTTKDIAKKRSKLGAITSNAAANTEPLQELIARHVDETVVQAIAVEHKKGRNLIVGTTNLDVKRPVIWNLGAIASSGHPDALEWIHKLLLASASIPGAFPPVLLEVEAGGEMYDEMHVDGGAAAQVFLYPVGLNWSRLLEKLEVPGTPRIFIIRNSRMAPKWKPVKNRLLPIMGGSVSALIRTQGIGDLYRIYQTALKDGMDYNLAYIPDDFDEIPQEQFDPVYMRKLFDIGYELAADGYPWDKLPPHMEDIYGE